MAKPLIVIVETDMEHLIPLELKMAETLIDIADIEIISEPEYMTEYFMSPRTIDILVIEEDMYTERLSMHTIGKTFVLVDEMGENDEPVYKMRGVIGETICLFRYCNINTLVGYIIPLEWSGANIKEKEPQIVAVISPAGGVGTTTVAVGLSACLKQNLKKVLYLNMQNYQDFYYYFGNKEMLPTQIAAYLKNPDASIYKKMQEYIRKEEFSYLPALRTSRESLEISSQGYMELARAAQRSGDYDFIIVEIGNELSSDVIKFLKYVNKIFVVVKQDVHTALKLAVMKYSINCSDKEKYTFLCNFFEKEKENAFLDNEENANIINGYIEKLAEGKKLRTCKDLKAVDGIQKATFMLL